MTPRLASHVVVFGPSDRSLQDLLAALGARVTANPADQLAIFAVSGASPDIAIIDVRRISGLPDGTAAFRRRHPGCPMVLISTTLDPGLMLDAMRSGISECVTEPLSEEGLLAAIGRVTAQRQPDVNGDIYAFVGAKGGIGTTTLAVNTASALAKRERTLFVDLNVAGGDAAVFLGAEPRFSVTDALDNIHRLDEALFKTLVVATGAKVDLLASSAQKMGWSIDAKRIRPLLEFARRFYRYIVVDCPRSDIGVMEALESAGRIVLVANQELATLRNGSRMATLLRERFGRNRVMVVANRFDVASDISHQDIERVLGTSVKHAVPSDYRASLLALTQGTPLMLKQQTRLVGAIEALARDLAGLPAQTAVTVRGTGLLGILTGKK